MTDKKYEEWRIVPDYDSKYQVSNLGRVKSRRGLLKPFKGGRGYLRVGFYKKGENGKLRCKSVHSLVLLAFDQPRPEGSIIRHLDGNPANNTIDNLSYGTSKENEKDKQGHGRTLYGEKQGNSKLKIEEVMFINANKHKYTSYQLAKKLNRKSTTIQHVMDGNSWVRAIKEELRK